MPTDARDERFRLVHPNTGEGVVLSVVHDAAGVYLRLARGPSLQKPVDVQTYGPFSLPDASTHRLRLLDELSTQGYLPPAHHDVLVGLGALSPKARSLAALRASYTRDLRFVEPLLKNVAAQKEDVSSATEALGRLGFARAATAVRSEAERKLLSRRRAGVEALRFLQDKDGLRAQLPAQNARLPDAVREALDAVSFQRQVLVAAIAAVPARERGLVIDTVYERGGSHAAEADVALCVVDALLASPWFEPHLWRYTKSIWKRALLRDDAETAFAIVHAIDLKSQQRLLSPAPMARAVLKSGRDGQERSTSVFAPRTAAYVLRRTWRYLRTIAHHQPERYAPIAAVALCAWAPGDEIFASRRGRTHYSYIFANILQRGASALRFDAGAAKVTLGQGKGKSLAITPAYQTLWSQSPQAFLVLLRRTRHAHVMNWAITEVLTHHRAIIASASDDEVLQLASHADARIREWASAELAQRLAAPTWPLLQALLTSADAKLVEQALTALPTLLVDESTLNSCISAALAHDALLIAVTPALITALVGKSAASAQSLAQRLLLATSATANADADDVQARLQALVALLLSPGLKSATVAQVSFDEAVRLLHQRTPVAELGMVAVFASPQRRDVQTAQWLRWAEHPLRVVREAALPQLLGAGLEVSQLAVLLDSDFDDVRAAVSAHVLALPVGALDLDALMSLTDSTRMAQQRVSATLLQKHVAHLDIHEAIVRLAEHPGTTMKALGVDLAQAHLRPGYVRLARLEPLLRGVLLDVKAPSALRHRVILFLAERGQSDAMQAEVASAILKDVLPSTVKKTRDAAIAALTAIRLAQPDTASPVEILA